MAARRRVARHRARPRLLTAEFWAEALDDAVRHGATSALAGLGGQALGVVTLVSLRDVALLGAGGFLCSVLWSLSGTRRGPPARANRGPSAAAQMPVERSLTRRP